MQQNIDTEVVAGFGDEWSRFDQTAPTEFFLSQSRLIESRPLVAKAGNYFVINIFG